LITDAVVKESQSSTLSTAKHHLDAVGRFVEAEPLFSFSALSAL
jgi:hypothetical protein